MTEMASPWDALLHLSKPIRLQQSQREPEAQAGTKLAALLAELATRESADTFTLCACLDLSSRQVWGLLKHPRDIGQVRFEAGRWSLVPDFAGRDVQRAAALLREKGWTMLPPGEEP